jgi:hypothetical protein
MEQPKSVEIIPFEGPRDLATVTVRPQAACRFSGWCEGRGLYDLARVKPIHVATCIEELG